MQAVDHFILFDSAQYIRRGWINKNRILLNGQPHTFTIPIKKCPQQTLIKDVQLALTEQHRTKLWKTLVQAYKSAPYWTATSPLIKNLLWMNTESLNQLIYQQFLSMYSYLDLPINFSFSSDLTNAHTTGTQERIFAICLELNADSYVNALSGQHLYSFTDFLSEGLHLGFIKSLVTSYPQPSTFQSNLSIIDVIMWNSPAEVRSLLNKYEIVTECTTTQGEL